MNFEGELRKEASLLEQEAPPLLAGEFPSHAFPPVLVRYAQTLSETFRIPPAMFLVTMLGAVSAAAGKGWRLVEAAPGMSNYANIYNCRYFLQVYDKRHSIRQCRWNIYCKPNKCSWL